MIAEKPSVGAAIGKVLGASSRKDGYLEGNNYIVSWCVGHLVGLADASSYDERFAKWRYSDLPIVPDRVVFQRADPQALERLRATGFLVDQPKNQLALAPRIGGADKLGHTLIA